MNAKRRNSDELPDDVEALKAIVAQHAELIAQHAELIAQRDEKIAAQRIVIEHLRKYAFGKKSEKRPRPADLVEADGQGHLFHAELLAEAERTAKAKRVQGEITLDPPKRPAPRKGRRATFPDHLPRITTRYELEDDACACEHCGGALHEIGEESTRELERFESAVVHEIRRAKYACRKCQDGVTTAPGPDRVIDKGLLGPGFLAHVAVERFGQHLPYNRLEKKYASEGLSLSRSVLERSMKTLSEILQPIRDRLLTEVLDAPELFTDDTPVTIAQPRAGPGSKKGRVWIYLDREGRHAYDFSDSRKSDRPKSVLRGYAGAIHADAFPGYDQLFMPEGATEVACWAHTRRKFVDAESTESKLAKEAIERIGELYAVERAAKDGELDDDARCTLRQQRSRPIADELFAWMAATQATVLPKSPMGEALKYALNLETALRRYLDNGRLSIDNNAAERALRAVAVGRKNWIFFQTDGGGDAAVVLLSLVMTAKSIGINPRTYRRDVMLRIAHETDVAKLTPHGWREHFQAEVEAERDLALAHFAGQ
ncbi:MAG: IS66 family transposase [bacterium]|nr:IS66 family transposase [bacterium]